MLLHFVAFDLENADKEDGTCYDSLNIYDGVDGSAHRIAHLCGKEMPEDIMSSGNILFIFFITDVSSKGKGFTINYKATQPLGTWKL